jgi:phage shock protein C
MLFGVCGGLGEYFDVDPTLMRLLFVALVVMGAGGGLLLYIAMVILVPEKSLGREIAGPNTRAQSPGLTELDAMALNENLTAESPVA